VEPTTTNIQASYIFVTNLFQKKIAKKNKQKDVMYGKQIVTAERAVVLLTPLKKKTQVSLHISLGFFYLT